MYIYDDVLKSSLEYFNGDQLAAEVFAKKYALKNKEGEYLEKNPDEMHQRLAKEFARIELKYSNPMSEEYIYSFLKDFKYIVPQGSPMMGIGNEYIQMSLSNCTVVESPKDSISGIINTARDIANLCKRRCVEENTKVWTDRGLVSIKDITLDDCVLSLDPGTQLNEYCRVLDKFETQVDQQDRIVIQLQNGTQLKTSKKHPVALLDKSNGNIVYRNAIEVGPTDILIKPSGIPAYSIGSSELYQKIGWFIGCHMGDGSCDIVKRPYNINKYEVRFRCAGNNENVIKTYRNVFNRISDSTANYHISSNKAYKTTVWEYSNANNGNRIINETYLNNQIGSKTYTGFIPQFIKDNNLWIQFIAGLADSNGTIKNGSLVISLCAKSIIDELSSWLSANKIRIHVGTYQSKRENEQLTYKLTINNGQEILDHISQFMAHEDKKVKINVGSTQSYKYFMTEKEINKVTDSYKKYYQHKVSGDNIVSIICQLKQDRNGCGISALKAFLNAKILSIYDYNKIICRVPVKEVIQDTDSTKYYDIEVSENNNFFAGNYGLINIHNCGVGLDISSLRPDGTAVSNAAGTTSGAWSFADLYSYITRIIGQNGRRGALMITMDVRHPDIMKFIQMKHDLTKVTGANISVKLTDNFMRAVEEDRNYVQYWPVDALIGETVANQQDIPAREVWNAIIESATKTAEPGLLMWDNITSMLPADCYPQFKTCSTNPCSELPLSTYDSCRLISINLKHLINHPFTEKASLDIEKYQEVIEVAMRLSDDLIDLELEKIDSILSVVDTEDEIELWNKIKVSCEQGRRTGLGTHGLADCLARLRLRYDSTDAIARTNLIYCLLKEDAYTTSIELAQERGAFPAFNWELEKDNQFINNLPLTHQEAIEAHGRRNISLLTNAPTGSVSILSQCSSGIEPIYQLQYTRRRKKNHDEEPNDQDYVDNMGDRWTEYNVFHHNVDEYMQLHDMHGNLTGDYPLGSYLPGYFITSSEIDWQKRIEIQATIQNHIDHSISSTINLPAGTNEEVVGELYKQAWQLGLKGLTVYVDGSRAGVLVSNKKEEDKFQYLDSYRRPECLECDIHNASIKGERWTIIVGMLDDKPYEIFGGLAEDIEIPSKYKRGIICKRTLKSGKNIYDLALEDGIKLKNIVKLFDNQLYQVHTRMISLSLRHGTRPSFLVEQLLKDPENDLTSFSKVVARVLKKYIQDGTSVTSDKTCPECKTLGLVYTDGCPKCVHCGWTKCQ